MKRFEMIQHFEKVFDLMKPADEKSNEAFAWYSGLSELSLNFVSHLFCDKCVVEKKVDELVKKAPFGISPCF